jgi:phosphate uptake regulator
MWSKTVEGGKIELVDEQFRASMRQLETTFMLEIITLRFQCRLKCYFVAKAIERISDQMAKNIAEYICVW